MENATIVTLSPHAEGYVPSFEEAFGEYSEVRGKGRAKRQQRRKTRRLKRVEDRGEVRAARRQIRAEAQADRQERRNVKVTSRLARKALKKEFRSSDDEAPEADDFKENQEMNEPQDETIQAQDISESNEDSQEDSEETQAQPYDFENGESFDGETSAINPEIEDLTHRIVWNQEMLDRYMKDRKNLDAIYVQLGASPQGKQGLSEVKSKIEGKNINIQKHQARIGQLNSHLKKYGDHPHIGKGMMMARTKLQKHREKGLMSKDKKSVRETLVPKSMHASISENKIEIPASSNGKVVELSSSAEGKKDELVLSPLAKIGVVIGVFAVAYILFKKV